MPDDMPTPKSAAPAVVPEAPKKKCPGCGHNVGTPHDKNCIYGGTVEEINAV